MKSKSVLLSEFVAVKLANMINSKKALELLIKGIVSFALQKKIVSDIELHKIFDEAINNHK